MKKYFALIILINYHFLLIVNAQRLQYPNLWNVEIRSEINYNNSERMFYYTYSVSNNAKNIGSISEIEIDISRKSGTINIDTFGLKFKNDGYTEKNFRLDFPHLQDKIVPVGFIEKPTKWSTNLSNDMTVMFFTSRSYSIHPKNNLNGFKIMSKGIPSIRRCIVSPLFDIMALFPNPDTVVSYYVPPIDSVRNAVKFYGWTIGPTAPLLKFDPMIWCDTLTSYIKQCHLLGWINNTRDDDCDDDEKSEDGIVKNLDNRLEKARNFIEKTQYNKAQQQLDKFLNKVEKLWKRQQTEEAKNKKNPKIIFTSEAYALLNYNTEYLEDQLPEKIKK